MSWLAGAIALVASAGSHHCQAVVNHLRRCHRMATAATNQPQIKLECKDLQFKNMPDENLPNPSQGNALQTTGQKTAIRAGGWILTLVVVGLWIGAKQIWNGSESIQPIAEAQYTVEINQASERDLLNLPEVGPSLARNILSYREKHGDFHSLSDFGDVPGVGPQTLKQLAPFLSFAHSSKAAAGDTTSETTTSEATEETILTAQSRERIAP